MGRLGLTAHHVRSCSMGLFDAPVETTSRKTLRVQKDVDTLDGPSSSQVFLVWVGSDSLPTMYDDFERVDFEVALQSAVKVYGKENITIVSDSLLPAKNWYPKIWNVSSLSAVKVYGKDNITIVSDSLLPPKDWYPKIWNVPSLELASQLTDIRPQSEWNNFFRRLKDPAHHADFLRIALIYLYGGLYADFDSLWIRPAPIHYPFTIDGNTTKRTFQPGNSNGVLGGEAGHKFFRQILEQMPSAYGNGWNDIGSKLIDKVTATCNCDDDFERVDFDTFYGISWSRAKESFTEPMNDTREKKLKEILESSHQLHLFGHITEIGTGAVPARDSLYAKVLEYLSIDVEYADPTPTKSPTVQRISPPARRTTNSESIPIPRTVSLKDGPSSSQVFLVWVGSDSLPTMYEVALQSAVKVYGKENITIVSDSLLPAKDWYPKIWNVSSLELASQLTDIRPQSEWNNFFRRLKDPAHHADFLRIALIYLYGGLYADFDSLWIRPAPIHYPFTIDGNITKRTFQPGNSNGVLGGEAGHKFFRQILEQMPSAYGNGWNDIGSRLIDKVTATCNCDADFERVDFDTFYGISWSRAKESFTEPMNDTREKKLKEILESSHQLHLFGHITEIGTGAVPAKDSLYAKVLEHLSIDIQYKDPKVARKRTLRA